MGAGKKTHPLEIPADSKVIQVDGRWTKIVHKCRTPTGEEINKVQADSGSEWTCNNCTSVWELAEGERSGFGLLAVKWLRVNDDEE